MEVPSTLLESLLISDFCMLNKHGRYLLIELGLLRNSVFKIITKQNKLLVFGTL